MPESIRDKGENPIVDSLSVASEWTIVSKCALHGLIYVWDLKATLAAGSSIIKKNTERVRQLFKCRIYRISLRVVAHTVSAYQNKCMLYG